MDRQFSRVFRSIELIDRVPEDIKHSAKHYFSYRYRDSSSCSLYCESSLDPIYWIHSDGTHDIITELLLDFEDELVWSTLYFESLVDTRDIPRREFDIDDDSDNFSDDTCMSHRNLEFRI
jgi:hypothetical protein